MNISPLFSNQARSIVLLLCMGVMSITHAADHVIPLPFGGSLNVERFIADFWIQVCKNPAYLCRTCKPERTGHWIPHDNVWPIAITYNHSIIDNINYSYRHMAVDYHTAGPSLGCAPCGSSGVQACSDQVPLLEIERVHRFRDVAYPSSFGPGVFQKYDVSLQLFTTGTGERYIDFFDPGSPVATRFFDGAWSGNSFGYTDVADGRYRDLISNSYSQLQLLDKEGQLTTSHAAAVQAVLNDHEGCTWRFQIISLGGGVYAGRILRIEDPRGYAIACGYRYQVEDDLQGSQSRLWQLATITDASGDVATFHYADNQVSGRWVVDQIIMPNNASVSYQYSGGYLSSIAHPDGTASSFTYTWNGSSMCTVLGIDDAAAAPTHRRKSAHVTTHFTVGSGTDGVFMPQSAQLIRLVIDGADQVSYFNIPHPWATAGYVYEGGSSFTYLAFDLWSDLVGYGRKANSWTISRASESTPWAWSNVAVSLESGFETRGFSKTDNDKALYRNEPKWSRDSSNTTASYTGFNSASGYIQKAYPDGTTELYSCDSLQGVVRKIDRIGRVTEQTFDAVGSRLSRTTGSIWNATGGSVVATPDTATEQWEYVPAGQLNQYRLSASIDANGNRTDYAYDARGRLVSVTSPPDVIGGPRAVTSYEYDSASRLVKIIQPTVTNWVQFEYDVRGRAKKTSYADGSTEITSYGLGVNANLVMEKKDRNGNVTSFAYDLDGRLVQELVCGPPPTGVVARTRSWTYLAGTNVVASTTDNGELSQSVLDSKNRQVATIRRPTASSQLVSSNAIDSLNRALGPVDPYARASWFVYDVNNRVTRTVRELVSGALASQVPADVAARSTFLSGLPRVGGANPGYTIEGVTYDPEGQILSRTNAAGTVTIFTYTNRGQVASQTEAFGTPIAATTTFTYDVAGNLLTSTGPRSTTTMTYTGRNLLATVTEASGTGESTLVRSMTYTPTKKVATETDALGRTTAFDYGLCCDRLKKITDPAGFQTQFLYDFNGNRTSVTDANGLTSTTTFDALNRLVTSSNAASETTTMVYDENLADGVGVDSPAHAAVVAVLPSLGLGVGADGSAVAVTNPKGETAYELRDGLGRPVARIDPLGNTTKIAYDTVVSGLVETAQTDALNHTTKVRADAAGRARIQIDALSNQTLVGFSADGDQVSQIDVMGVGWTASFDARHRLLSRTTTRSGVVETMSWGYDLDGNRLTETDALNKTEVSEYDLRNRRTKLTDRLNGITRFGFDAIGNLTAISDAENEVRGGLANLTGATQYAYNSRNLLTAEAFPTGQAGRTLRTYAYDGGRRLTNRQVGILSGAFTATPAFSGTAEVTNYLYDAASRLATRSYADAKNDTFGYDLASRLTSAVSARYTTTVGRVYDAAGRLTSESLTLPDGTLSGTVVAPITYTVGYSYDADNRTTGISYPTGTQVVRTYTNRNELASVSMGGSTVATRSYDATGRLISTAFGNGVAEARTYVPGSPLVATIAAAPSVGPAVTGFSYTYDAAGRKKTENNSAASDQSFDYDFAGRLIDWKKGPTAAPTATQTWNLSLVGDWNSTNRDGVAENRQNTWVHEAVQVGTNLLTYDAKGNLTKDEKQTILAWDPENRLKSALVTPDASETGFGAVASYRYNALGRRVAKTVNSTTTLFLNAGAQTVVELERTAIPTQAQVNGAESDGTAANAALTPASGGILAGIGAVTRINFQPEASVIPAGFYADKGKTFPASGLTRTNGLTYGWATNATANAVERHGAVPLTEFDTFIKAQTTANNSWSIALPNGSYPVVVVAGDALSADQTNNLVIGGQAVTDATPATTSPGYDQGNFDGYANQVTVTNGVLVVTPATGALRAKLCFIEIGAQGTLLTQVHRDRLSALVARANSWTGASVPPQTVVREYAYQTYVDDVAAFTSAVNGGAATRYYVASNHLYSPAAVTNGAGQLVERFAYTAYGKQAKTVMPGQVATSFDRGFTGYIVDNETKLSYARRRYYSTDIGAFISRDPFVYVMGPNQYRGHFVPNALDPFGTFSITVTLTTVISYVELFGDLGQTNYDQATAVISANCKEKKCTGSYLGCVKPCYNDGKIDITMPISIKARFPFVSGMFNCKTMRPAKPGDNQRDLREVNESFVKRHENEHAQQFKRHVETAANKIGEKCFEPCVPPPVWPWSMSACSDNFVSDLRLAFISGAQAALNESTSIPSPRDNPDGYYGSPMETEANKAACKGLF